jgi:hypothetical protein
MSWEGNLGYISELIKKLAEIGRTIEASVPDQADVLAYSL